MTSRLGRKYGCKPSPPSLKIGRFRPELKAESELPQSIDLRPSFPPYYDQGDLGACVDNSIAALVQRKLMADNSPFTSIPSRLFLYWNARNLEGTTEEDSGSTVSDGVQSLNKYGVCPETGSDGTASSATWPYNTAVFTQKPPKQCYEDAILHHCTQQQIVSLDRLTVLNTLAAGNPFCFGITLYSSFEEQSTLDSAIMPIPSAEEEELGGHCMSIVGYVLNTPMGNQGVIDWAICRNSWGNVYGNGMLGSFYMPLDEVLCNDQLTMDAHVISVMTDDSRST